MSARRREKVLTEEIKSFLGFEAMNDILRDVRLEIGRATAPHHYSSEERLIDWAMTGDAKIQKLDILAKLRRNG